MFDPNSRYAAAVPFLVHDRLRDRTVSVVPPAPDPHETLLGLHQLREGQRLDHLAFHYLGDATYFWRISELADVMLPEALSEARDIPIPNKGR